MDANKSSIFDLTPPEKLQLVEDLWDDLAALPGQVPVYRWQIDELDRRKANLKSAPASASTWEDVRDRIRARHGR